MTHGEPQGLSVVIPAFNEEKAIGDVLDRTGKALRAADLPHEIIVVDDGSVDRTARIAAERSVQLLQHADNKGYGAALKTGIRAARFRHVAILDADGTYNEQDLPALAEHMHDFDMVVGARTGKDARIPWVRRPAKWILRILASLIVDTPIPDFNSGFRIFDREVARIFFSILPARFSFTTTLTMAMLTNGYTVKYLPTSYHKRKGKSKIRPIHDTMGFLALIVRTALYFSPLRVFIPLSLVIIGLSLVKMILIDILLIQNLTESTLLLLLAGIQVAMLGLLADLIDKRSPPWGKDQ